MQEAANRKSLFGVLRIAIWETDSGQPQRSVPRKRKDQGLLKTQSQEKKKTSQEAVKGFLPRTVTDSRK